MNSLWTFRRYPKIGCEVAGAYWFFFDAAKNVNDDREILQEECEGREGRGGARRKVTCYTGVVTFRKLRIPMDSLCTQRPPGMNGFQVRSERA